MKVAAFLHRADFGGAQWRVVLVGEELRKIGVSTTVIFPKNNDMRYENFLKKRNFSYFRIDARILRKLSRLLNNALFFLLLPFDVIRTITYLNSHEYSIIHVNGLTNFVPVLSGRILGSNVLWHFNDTMTPKWFFYLMRPLVLNLNVYICAASQAVTDQYGLGSSKINYLGVLPPPISVEVSDTNVLIDDDRLANKYIIGFVGNLLHLKGIEDYLKVIHSLSKAKENIVGVIVGDFIESDKKYKLEIITLINRLNIHDKIIFLGYRSDVVGIMKKFNVLLYPSHSEAAPIVVLQALFTGIPIVGTKVGAVPEWLSVCGMPTVQVGDTLRMHSEVIKILNLSTDELEIYKINAQNFAEEFTVDSVAAMHLDFYKKILK